MKCRKNTIEYNNIVERLEELNNVGVIDAYVMLIIKDMTKIVVRNLAIKCERVKKGVASVMGGRVIECEAKRIRDAALEEGREEGRMLAKAELEKAKAQDIVILINILRKYDATEDAIINEIVDTYKLSRKEAEKYLKS